MEPQSLITVSFWFRDFTLLRSAVFTSGPLTEGYYAIGDMTETELIPKEIERGISVIYFLSNVSVLTLRGEPHGGSLRGFHHRAGLAGVPHAALQP